jgi:hypothetical protein
MQLREHLRKIRISPMEQWRYLLGVTASLHRTLSTLEHPHSTARNAENTSPPGSHTFEEQRHEEVPWSITHANLASREDSQEFLIAR